MPFEDLSISQPDVEVALNFVTNSQIVAHQMFFSQGGEGREQVFLPRNVDGGSKDIFGIGDEIEKIVLYKGENPDVRLDLYAFEITSFMSLLEGDLSQLLEGTKTYISPQDTVRIEGERKSFMNRLKGGEQHPGEHFAIIFDPMFKAIAECGGEEAREETNDFSLLWRPLLDDTKSVSQLYAQYCVEKVSDRSMHR